MDSPPPPVGAALGFVKRALRARSATLRLAWPPMPASRCREPATNLAKRHGDTSDESSPRYHGLPSEHRLRARPPRARRVLRRGHRNPHEYRYRQRVGPATVAPQVTKPSGTSPQAGAALPADPCVPTIAAIKSLGWSVTKAEAGLGPGGPNTKCTFQADRGNTSSDNGWVAYIPASQMSLEYHQPEAIAGVGVEAFRGSPQSGEILATGASPGFRLFVASGDDAALKFAKALVSGS